MSQNNSAYWDQVLRARDKLEEQVGSCPAVDFIDIGYARDGDEEFDIIALRVHLQEQTSQDKFPSLVDGIPVVAVKQEK